MIDANNEIIGEKPEVRYIKLGPGNAWAERAIRDGEVPFSFREVPHELALRGDEREIAAHLIARGKASGAAMSAARQICTFYTLDSEAIWITFADGLMWWTHAEAEVTWRGDVDDYAPRIRRARGGWTCTNRFDVPFYINGLSSRLTKVANTQQTLCRVEAADYAIRKIWSCEEPSTKRALEAKGGILSAIDGLIADLHWSDFETLVDLLLVRSGWHRVSPIGGTMKDADIIAEQAITREVAFVQVKSAARQSDLDRYVEIFDKNGEWSRMIFACHSPGGPLASYRADVMVWSRSELADLIFRNGLFDWLLSRTA